MRKLLTDWRTAGLTLLAVVLVFTPIGAQRSLTAAVKDVEAGLWKGVDGRAPLADFIFDAKNAATGLLVTAGRYEVDSRYTDSLRQAQTALMDCLESPDPKPSELCALVAALDRPMEAVYGALREHELDEPDAEAAQAYMKGYENARSAMGRSNYNESVESFINDVYSHFPAKLIGPLLGVEPPESFE